MSESILPPSTHLYFLPEPVPGQPCVVCYRAEPDFICQRCGAPMHGTCYWQAVASEAERQAVAAAVAEINALPTVGEVTVQSGEQEFTIPVRVEKCAGDDYLERQSCMMCPGCRS